MFIENVDLNLKKSYQILEDTGSFAKNTDDQSKACRKKL